MISILTGDIIHSRSIEPTVWLPVLKEVLHKLTNADTTKWEIYRGDSFQLEISTPDAFKAAVCIKATIKQIKGLDVRIAIGLGSKTHEGASISEATGSAFVNSGETLETLKKEKINLAIKSGNALADKELNLLFKLALIAMNQWTPNSAEIIILTLENPELSQTELGELAGIKQNTVSERQKRAYLQEILEVNAAYQQKITTLTT
jgi:hypothetical protein